LNVLNDSKRRSIRGNPSDRNGIDLNREMF
jgi:hypothetical protein